MSLFSRCIRFFALAVLVFLVGCRSLPPVSPLPVSYHPAQGATPITLNTQDHLQLFAQWWKPVDTQPKAVVLLIHGTIAHSGFYAPWANDLTAHGYAVLGLDLRGWGQSQGHGRRGYVTDVGEYVDDLALAYREVKKTYPDLPLYLQGESLGGGVVVMADLRGDLPSQGLILNAPGIKGRLGRWMPDWLATGSVWTVGNAAEVWPNFPAVPMGNDFLFEHLGKTFIFDAEARQRAHDDPFITHSALAAAWLTAVKDMGQRSRKGLSKISTPFIVLQGSKDNLVPTSASELLMEKTASTDKTRKFYPGMSHCTLHDLGKELVWADIISWLDERVPQPPKAETIVLAPSGDMQQQVESLVP